MKEENQSDKKEQEGQRGLIDCNDDCPPDKKKVKVYENGKVIGCKCVRRR